MAKFPVFKQTDAMNCGPTCLKMISKHYGKTISIEKIQLLSETTREGTNLYSLADAAEKIGFKTVGAQISYNKLVNDAPLPCIVHWNNNHFIVVYKIKKNIIYTADPVQGLVKFKKRDFINNWINVKADSRTEAGIVLLLETTPLFLEKKHENENAKGFSLIFQHLYKYKKFILQLLIGLLIGSILQLFIPFLTQSLVDIGIQNKNVDFIYIVIIAQLFIYAGKISVDIIRGWILLHMTTRIRITLISDFFIKLMRLSISYFDSKMTGDLLQRINDHKRIENLLTTGSLNSLFSITNILIFGSVLAWYDLKIFIYFLLGSSFYLLWVLLFLKRRKFYDYLKFSELSKEQSKIIELISGMQAIKMHNAERQKRWGWEYVQSALFKIEIKSLKLEQAQTIGSAVINELKNIIITLLTANLVIEGEITLGMMMAITYIIGQLNSPIQQLIDFVHTVQDAKIALERLSEIHNKDDEESADEQKVVDLPDELGFEINDLSFRYLGTSGSVIKKLSLTILPNKITAIVGASGSGKTTLMKILLKFYEPQSGEIKVNHHNLNSISQKAWRDKCGVVMQEGYIFNDTIANNIAIGQDRIDQKKLLRAIEVANIKDFIESLPLGFNTKIGMEGVGMSTGQKQRLLIARAVYKDPEIICFDEATSALDAKNERVIMENLNEFFKDRTAIVIAHRLSTVKNADQIVVLDQGKVIEKGTHAELVRHKGSYYSLVKNQLDLEKLNS